MQSLMDYISRGSSNINGNGIQLYHINGRIHTERNFENFKNMMLPSLEKEFIVLRGPCVLTHLDRYIDWNYTHFSGVLSTHLNPSYSKLYYINSIPFIFFLFIVGTRNTLGIVKWKIRISHFRNLMKKFICLRRNNFLHCKKTTHWCDSLFSSWWVIISQRSLWKKWIYHIHFHTDSMTAYELKYWNSFIQLEIALHTRPVMEKWFLLALEEVNK